MAKPAAKPPVTGTERVVVATSEDGYQFTGLLCSSSQPSTALVLWVHGIHLGFAEPEYCNIGRAVAAGGVAFLSVQTRGHDFGAWLRGPGGAKLAGSGWEIFAESLADLGGWMQLARSLGFEQVILAGHGYGAAKAVFYQAERQDRLVRGVVLASSGSMVRDTLDPNQLAAAEQMAAQGRAQDLMPWGTRPGALRSTVSAQVYLSRARVHRDLYGYGEQPPALSRVSCPLLAWFGDRETKEGRDPKLFLDTIRRNATRAAFVETRIVRGASYLYGGAEPAIARELLRWVGRVTEPTAPQTQEASHE